MSITSWTLGAVRALCAPTAGAGTSSAPSREVVVASATRQLIGVLFVGTAAASCWRGEVAGQALPYAVMAVARVPDLLVAVLALVDDGRRQGLRATRRPGLLAGTLAAVLGIAAVAALVTGAVTASWAAATLAGVGLAVAAWPVQLVPPTPEPRGGGRDRELVGQTGTSSTAPTA